MYAQDSCSGLIDPTVDLGMTPGPFFVGSTVRVDILIGVLSVQGGTELDIDQVEYALDCAGGGLVDACVDETAKISYEANFSTDCGVTFSVTHSAGDTSPNTVVFTPDSTLALPANNTCTLSFDVELQEAPSADGTPNTYEGAARQEGMCDNGLDGAADGTIGIDLDTCEVSLDKQISCDGGATWVDQGQVDSIEGCISTGGQITARYLVSNLGSAEATCTLNDDILNFTGEDQSFTTDSIPTFQTDAADCNVNTAGVNEATLACSCGGGDIVLDDLTDEAEHGCCDIQIDKQVSCADDPFSDVGFADGTVDGCVSWNAFDGMDAEGIDIQYVTDMSGVSGNVVLNDCTLTETNAYVLASPAMDLEVEVGDASSLPSLNSDCSDENLKLGETGNENTATLACDCALEDDNEVAEVQVSDMDTAGFECQTPGLMISKTCEVPDGEIADIEVTVTNTGDALLDNCIATDDLASDDLCNGPFTAVALSDNDPIIVDPANFALIAGDDQVFDGMTAVGGTICNTASVTCDIAGTEKTITSDTDTLCESNPPGCLTRTIGFHSNRSKFVDAIGTINVCGQTLSGYLEIDDLLCQRGQNILQAQCAAAALNVKASLEGEGTCIPTSESPAGPLLAVCCGEGEGGDVCNGESIDGCIEAVSAFNEDDDTLECFELAPGVDYCNPGRNGPLKCNGRGGTGAGGPPNKPAKPCRGNKCN
jgi:hypothetical protein